MKKSNNTKEFILLRIFTINRHQVYNSNIVEARATILAVTFAVELSATGEDGDAIVGAGIASDFLVSDSLTSVSEC